MFNLHGWEQPWLYMICFI